jgi:uncharacterized pyridoxamine 5'-phosphate oxidase family protein
VNKIVQFLLESKVFYVATVENDQPRVRPFSALAYWDGKIYICTNNEKAVYKQMTENPKIEISAMAGDKWIRFWGKVAVDPRLEARAAMIEANPMLKNMYKADDGKFEVLYFTEAKALVYSFNSAPEELTL